MCLSILNAMLNLLRGIADNIALLLRRESMLSSLRVTLVTLAGVTLGGWASAQTAVPGTSAEPFIYPSKGQTAQQEQKDKNECYGWASQQTGFDPAQELEAQQAAAARARQQSQQAQQRPYSRSRAPKARELVALRWAQPAEPSSARLRETPAGARRSVPPLDCWQDGTVVVQKRLQRQISSCRSSSRSQPISSATGGLPAKAG